MGEDINDCKLVTGTLKRHPEDLELEEFHAGDLEEGSV